MVPVVIVTVGIIGLMIQIEDKGPVFYKAKRLGKDGKAYNMFKLRSMKVDAPDLRNEDGSTYSSKNDPRVTKVGSFIRKTSLDEIPQIINVLIGDMSFVGPRPDMPDAINIYDKFEINKLSVRPGITGYNQAFYRNSINQKEKFKNDILYIERISFLLDCKIVLITIKNILIRKNINSSEIK